MAIRHSIAVAVALFSGAACAAAADPIAAANNELSQAAGWRNTAGSSNAALNLSASTQAGALYSAAAATYSFGHTLDFDVKIGNAVALGSVAQLTPYLSYEHHRWASVTYNAIGAGLLEQYEALPGVTIGADVFFGRTFSASMNDDSDAALSPSYAAAVGVSLDYVVVPHVHVIASYRFERFIANENTQTGMLGLAYAY